MSWHILRPQIKALLLANLTELFEVSGAPKLDFNGYPSAHVVPSSSPNDYETTRENKRVYAFQVRFFYDTKSLGVETAIERLEQIVDQAIDLIDQEDQKGATTRTVGKDLPTRYTFLNIKATPSLWGEVPDQQLVMAEISIQVQVSVDISE